MRIRLAVALLAALLNVVAGGLLTGAPAQAAGTPLTTMTFNVCGNVCRHGEVDLTTANIAYQVRTRRVAVAMFQELCYTQFLGIRDRLARYGYTATFAAASTGGHCADHDRQHGRSFGIALLAHGTMTGEVAHRLVSSSPVRPEARMVLGATVRLPGRTVFAVTTHTAPSGPNLAGQLSAIDRWLTPLAGTRPVLFGGDLNSLPASPGLDGFYASFREADGGRTDPRPTFMTVPRKIDYLFASPGFLHRRGATTSCGEYSDHCMYIGLFR